MQRLELNIHTKPALVGLETKLARAPVRTRLASFSLEKKPAMFSMKTKYPKIAIDSRLGWAELGQAGPEELNRRLRNQSQREVFDGIQRVAVEGDRLATFWEPGNTVEDIAAEGLPSPPLDIFNAPIHPVSVQADLGEVHINYRKGEVALRLGETPDPRTYKPGFASAYIRQRAAIDITWRRLDVLV
ncbi:MAG: DUF6470 family protein [bacterium]|jgi:hypothetical protein